jgi:hypothetical protein
VVGDERDEAFCYVSVGKSITREVGRGLVGLGEYAEEQVGEIPLFASDLVAST